MQRLKLTTHAAWYLIAALASGVGAASAYAAKPANTQSGQIVLAMEEEEHHSDALITTKVKAALFKANFTTGLDVSVSTHDGVVQLAGYVDKADQVNLATDVAGSVEGVKRVVNDLRIK